MERPREFEKRAHSQRHPDPSLTEIPLSGRIWLASCTLSWCRMVECINTQVRSFFKLIRWSLTVAFAVCSRRMRGHTRTSPHCRHLRLLQTQSTPSFYSPTSPFVQRSLQLYEPHTFSFSAPRRTARRARRPWAVEHDQPLLNINGPRSPLEDVPRPPVPDRKSVV